MVKISPEWVTSPEQGKSSVGFLPLASGPACLGMPFPPFLMKQLYRCDSVVISSFVRIGYTTRRWGWLLGRIGYSITHHYPLYEQHVSRMPRNRLPRVMKYYSPTGRRNHGRTLKRLLDTWDRNGSTSGPTPWQIYDDDDKIWKKQVALIMLIIALQFDVSTSFNM